MHRLLTVPLLAAVLLLPAACGSGDGAGGLPSLTAGQAFGEEPTISTDGSPPEDLQFSVVSEGSGPALKAGDAFVADFKGQPWDLEDATMVDSTFAAAPILKTIGAGEIPPGWDSKLPGVKVGSRVMIVESAPDSSQAAGQTYVFVIDVLDALDPELPADGEAVEAAEDLPKVTGEADPKVEIPAGKDPSTTMIDEVLLKGGGPEVKDGQLAVVHYTGVLWRNGEQFDSSWDREGGAVPFSFEVGKPGIIKAWNEGLLGKRVGSRVLLVVPPDKGYGAEGNGDIKGTDTMVFVIDILGAY